MNNHKTKILITVDTEFSIGGHFKNKKLKPVPADRHIYCKINGNDYGINLIMDILERYNHKGIFFVETESRFYFGEQAIFSIIQDIKDRGHEVQLHIHPNYHSFINKRRMPDDMRKYSLQEQTNIIKSALVFLSSHGIKDIFAFRSGGFYSDLNTIKAIRNNGIKYSSNYNLAYPNCDYIDNNRLRNDIFLIEQVFELPLTCYREFPLRKTWNSFQISATSYGEFMAALNHYYNQHIQLITILTHSFEFVRPKDIQFSKIAPNRLLIRRFDNICRFLASHVDKYEVITYQDLDKLINNNAVTLRSHFIDFYKSPLSKTSCRYLQNMVSRFLL